MRRRTTTILAAACFGLGLLATAALAVSFVWAFAVVRIDGGRTDAVLVEGGRIAFDTVVRSPPPAAAPPLPARVRWQTESAR